jgi:hypothetical protein
VYLTFFYNVLMSLEKQSRHNVTTRERCNNIAALEFNKLLIYTFLLSKIAISI